MILKTNRKYNFKSVCRYINRNVSIFKSLLTGFEFISLGERLHADFVKVNGGDVLEDGRIVVGGRGGAAPHFKKYKYKSLL